VGAAVLIRFFLMLRAAGVPATLTEFLALLEALSKGTFTFDNWAIIGDAHLFPMRWATAALMEKVNVPNYRR